MFDINNKKGFSLAELVVSLSIIAIISSIIVTNFHGFGRSGSVQMSAQFLANSVREAQNNALSLKEVSGSPPAGGWGIYFNIANPDQYILFGDADYPPDGYDPGEEVRIEKFQRGIKLIGITGGFASVVFTPPNPDIYIKVDAGPLIGSLPVSIGVDGNNRTIIINKFGLVDIN